jgi:O-antigen/teichoic acid export membrane protein
LFAAFAALLSVNAMTLLGGTLLPIVMARILGAHLLGLYASASALGLLLTVVIDWGYETRLPLLAAESPTAISAHFLDAQHIKNLLWCICTAVGGIIAFLFHPSANALFEEVLPVNVLFLVWALARSYSTTFAALTRGLQNFAAQARVENSVSAVMYGTAVATLFLPVSGAICLYAAIGCLIVGEVVKSFWYCAVLRSVSSLNHAGMFIATWNFRGIIKVSDAETQWEFVVFQTLSLLASRAGVFALTLLSVPQEVAYISNATRFTIAMRVLPGAMFNVLLPVFSREHLSRQTANNATLWRTLFFATIIGLGGSATLFFAAAPLVRLMYGDTFENVAVLLRIVAWLFLLQTVGSVVESYLMARAERRFVNLTMAVVLGVFAVACFTIPLQTAVSTAYGIVVLDAAVVLVYALRVVIIGRRS